MSSLIAIGAVLISQALMGIHVILGLLGSATFGSRLSSRVLAKVGAAIMIFFLGVEFVLFQFVARPSLQWCIVGVLLSGFVLWSFLMTAFTDPGTPSCQEWQLWSKERMQESIRALPPLEEKCKGWTAPGLTCHCETCKSPRPERAHHCKTCGRCVLRMDHHCPLIGNCVGWRNHKYYLLLQWWQFWACTVFLFAPGCPGELAVFGHVPGYEMEMVLDIGVAWAAVMMVITGKTFAEASVMAAGNITHVEAHYSGGNPYKLPHAIENLRQLVGPLDLLLLLPVACSRPCSGTSFPVRDEETISTAAVLKPLKTSGAEPSALYGSV